MKVKITNHAYNRWRQYMNDMKRTQLAALVERHLFAALRQGSPVIADSLHIDINSRIQAVVVPDKYGGWGVKTFILSKKGENKMLYIDEILRGITDTVPVGLIDNASEDLLYVYDKKLDLYGRNEYEVPEGYNSVDIAILDNDRQFPIYKFGGMLNSGEGFILDYSHVKK